ncbi:MAG: hypothetical protein ACI845_000073 [Gammaproteobacteria bacterium]|jgi:uncharacterized protein YceH (UPF0502 family)
MAINDLTNIELRIIGCLMEKSVTTPDQYPLTLNALVLACNQKSGRNPVMSLKPGEVQHCVRGLEVRHLIRVEENFSRGIEKYVHRFCNSSYSELQLDPAQYAIVCLLMLRGPQTPGEFRARSPRLHGFDDNQAVIASIDQLIAFESGPLLVKLLRTAGRKDSEYMHLFGGPIDIDALADAGESRKREPSALQKRIDELELRISQLESENVALKRQLENR